VLSMLQEMGSMLESEMAMMGFTMQHYIIVPGDKFPIGNLVTGVASDFYTGLPTPAAAVANTNKEQSNNVYNFDIFNQIVADRKKQYALTKQN
ncbi:MAG: hypothetical protein J6Q51_03830, partial [Clostridia bacterium]|nr:hypothetical protein [Clostridia bacterium]